MNTLLRIDALTLQNFRGFEEFQIDFHPEFNLLVGPNGSGKTSVMEALRMAVDAMIGGEVMLAPENVRLNVVERFGAAEAEGGSTRIEFRGITEHQPSHLSLVFLSAGGPEGHIRGTGTWGFGYLMKTTPQTVVTLPLTALYRANRNWQGLTMDPDSRSLPSRESGKQKWADAHLNFSQIVTWLRRQTYARLQRPEPQPLMDAILHSMLSCLPEAKRIYYDIRRGNLTAEMEDGRSLPFHLLSDGYQNILAVVADLAWRAVILNPHLGPDAIAKAQGIVLIDELDLHLHPSWQRRVIGDLRRTFPELQFIVTSHSPQLIASAHPSWVRVLDGSKTAKTVGYTTGKDTNSILVEVMGDRERPAEMEKRLSRLARLIDEQNTKEAETLLAELEGELGPDYTDLVEARWMLQAGG